MLRFRHVAIGMLVFALAANAAAAQSVNQASGRDPLWNGTLIGLGAGIGSAAALDAVFCDNGFGGCDVPWAAYLTLGAIGAGAGAGIDFLIGRKDARTTTLRLLPIVGPGRKGVLVKIRASLLAHSGRDIPGLGSRDRIALPRVHRTDR
jgi:hypothetical protein